MKPIVQGLFAFLLFILMMLIAFGCITLMQSHKVERRRLIFSSYKKNYFFLTFKKFKLPRHSTYSPTKLTIGQQDAYNLKLFEQNLPQNSTSLASKVSPTSSTILVSMTLSTSEEILPTIVKYF